MHTAFLPSKAGQTGIALAASFIAVATPIIRIRPLPMDQWPAWAKDLAQDRQPEDAGLGDTIAHVIGDARSERFKKWFKEKLGATCGCIERQRWLNQRFAYQGALESIAAQPIQ
jgi:hypothetical protein